MVNVLLIGQGAREHALASKISQSPLLGRLHLWPGHGAMAPLGTLWQGLPLTLSSQDFSPLIDRVLQEKIDLVVVGPETPLAGGLADQLHARGIPVFGPEQAAARLETDKAFAKGVMADAEIPTAAHMVTPSEQETRDKANSLVETKGGVVIKASGLAAGKGVFVCRSRSSVDEALQMLFHTDMRAAASTVVLEEILEGRECSYFVFLGPRNDATATTCHIPIGFAVDYKRLLDQDLGPNTGGMGCYTPVPWLPDDAGDIVERTIVEPLLKTLTKRGIPYCGCLYVGIMWSNGPKVVEFNVRLGDPEAQVLALQDSRDWLELMLQCTGLRSPLQPLGTLKSTHPRTTVGVVMVTPSYPYGKDRGVPGQLPLSLFQNSPSSLNSETRETGQVFAASIVSAGGQPLATPSGPVVETGVGRVLTVLGQGASFAEARFYAYQKAQEIKSIWPEAVFRSDIAQAVTTEGEGT